MKSRTLTCVALVSALAMPVLMTGCEKEVSSSKSKTIKSDGSVKTEEKSVTKSPDGTVTTKEETSKTPPTNP